jgi:hypothetical protein
VLETEAQARDYLRFFCAFVWGDDDAGSFGLITDAGDLPAALTPDPSILSLPCEQSADPQKGRWDLRAYTRYGDVLYLATYRVAANGSVEMLEDKELARYEWSEAGKLSSFSSPYRYPAAYTLTGMTNLKEYRSDFLGWVPLETDAEHIAEIGKAVPGWQNPITRRPYVLLSHASCKVLSDGDAKVWSAASRQIYLNGFDYHSVDVTPENFDRRLAWVRHLYSSPENSWTSFGWFLFTLFILACILLGSLVFALHRRDSGALHPFGDDFALRFAIAITILTTATLLFTYMFYKWRVQIRGAAEFNAQPYAHLASVLRSRGEDDLAKRVEAEKMWQEAQQRKNTSFLGMLSVISWWRPYGVLFGYGLSPFRAATSLVVLWILGWIAVSLLSGNQMLQANATRLAPAALIQSRTPLLIVPAGTEGTRAVSIPCGDAIEPGLYSFELLTPLLNLHQESRCEIHAKPNGNFMTFFGRPWKVPSIFIHTSLWEYGKALYMLVGSILSSLALLTFSGIARRWEN